MLVAARRRAAVRVTAAPVAALFLAAGPAPTFPPAPATARRVGGAPMRRPGSAPAPTDGDPVVRTIVRAGGTEVDVHLIGVRPFSADHPYRWAARTDDP